MQPMGSEWSASSSFRQPDTGREVCVCVCVCVCVQDCGVVRGVCVCRSVEW